MTGAPGLELIDLAVRRGDTRLFEGLSLAIGPGDLATVVGPNGAGKTSLLRVVAGLSQPDHGEVRWGGNLAGAGDPAFAEQRLYLGHLPGLKGDLSIGENLRFLLGLQGMHTDGQRMHECLEQLGLADALDRPVRQLSAGQRRRTALARLHLSSSALWLLDEPLTNLDTAGQGLVCRWLDEHLHRGGMAMVASHAPLAVTLPGRRLEVELGG